jgi:hypothetical protein
MPLMKEKAKRKFKMGPLGPHNVNGGIKHHLIIYGNKKNKII